MFSVFFLHQVQTKPYIPGDIVIFTHDYTVSAPAKDAPLSVQSTHLMSSQGKILPAVSGLGLYFNIIYDLRKGSNPIKQRQLVTDSQLKAMRKRSSADGDDGDIGDEDEDVGAGLEEDDEEGPCSARKRSRSELVNDEDDGEEEVPELEPRPRLKKRRTNDSRTKNLEQDAPRITRSRAAAPSTTQGHKTVSFAKTPEEFFDSDGGSGRDSDYRPENDGGVPVARRQVFDCVQVTPPRSEERADRAPGYPRPRPLHPVHGTSTSIAAPQASAVTGIHAQGLDRGRMVPENLLRPHQGAGPPPATAAPASAFAGMQGPHPGWGKAGVVNDTDTSSSSAAPPAVQFPDMRAGLQGLSMGSGVDLSSFTPQQLQQLRQQTSQLFSVLFPGGAT
ncbi:hypothetical protein FB45DRAFT_913768 [Roridomyces roridus]|uniref:Uncharacterized protein n=1 Tax=Roridomyces roridus TaxID=1738132 RepID=A0AAD7FQ62_9AGAR|nr:hypothetical protein FB45DRAFT_913768 [Roridomyces roridus]